jgi:uncharacterized protein YhfF
VTDLPARLKGLVAFSFGDSPALADELLALVLEGRKTATCSRLQDYGDGKEPMPQLGRHDVVLDGQARAAAVVETIELTYRRFDEVDAAFAYDEGEGDRSLSSWREAHETYFRRNGGFSPDMDLLCERFRVIEVLER